MQLYNVEFFTKELEYVGSQQISSIYLEYDYLSPDETTIGLNLETKCNIDNIISITELTGESIYLGIVTTINESKKEKTVKFKPLLSLFDVSVENGSYSSIENWIEGRIKNTYVNNVDSLQNISVLSIEVKTTTSGTIDTEEPIVNLLEMIGYLLKKYKVVVSFDIDHKRKNIKVIIERNSSEERVIEADLPNVLSKTLEIKTAATEDTVNKITIINIGEEGAGERATFYRENDGNITQTPELNKRITPVIFEITSIECDSEEFEEKALETAQNSLVEDEFNNLIELTVPVDDTLIYPGIYKIAQKVKIITNGNEYTTYYTGFKVSKGTTTMIFGAIRLELTKKLKRRLSK